MAAPGVVLSSLITFAVSLPALFNSHSKVFKHLVIAQMLAARLHDLLSLSVLRQGNDGLKGSVSAYPSINGISDRSLMELD